MTKKTSCAGPDPDHGPEPGRLRRQQRLLRFRLQLQYGRQHLPGGRSTGDTSTAGEITTAEEGKLILGTSADYPPFEFHILDENGEDQIVGLDVALGRQIAEDMGLEFEVIHMDFDNLFQLLNQGRCDMVIAAMEYNEERGENGGYSDGYYSDIPPQDHCEGRH